MSLGTGGGGLRLGNLRRLCESQDEFSKGLLNIIDNIILNMHNFPG